MTAQQIGGRKGGYVTASRYDGAVITAPARAGFMQRFYRQVDPLGVLPAAERERRAQAALKAYMQGLVLARHHKKLHRVK